MGECADAIVEGFAEATEDRLDHLGPGCFVQKMEVCGTCCWVELVTDEDEGTYKAIAHPVLYLERVVPVGADVAFVQLY